MQSQSSAPVANTVVVAAKRLGISRSRLYQLIAARELRTFKLGARTLIPETELQRFVAERMEVAA